MPRDAEARLAERGVRREPIRVEAPPATDVDPAADAGERAERPATPPASTTEPNGGTQEATGADGAGAGGAASPSSGPDLSARDAARVAGQAQADADLRRSDADATPDPSARRLEDDVAEAVAFVRRSTAVAPQAEGRVRDKLAGRGWSPPVIEQAMERARRERLVDDAAMVAALVEERQRKGHAPAKIRRDLRERGFDDVTLDAALRSAESQDLEAAAFAVAADKANRCSGLSAEAAFRRVVGHVVRRGYPEALARKVAREAVFTAREQERAAGH